MKITRNFRLYEFFFSQTAIDNGIDNTTEDEEVIYSIKRLCTKLLQPLRDQLNTNITINSGYRCKELNELVGGVATSQHCLGKAADIVARGVSPIMVAKAVLDAKLPFDQMIVYPTFVHVSLRYSNRKQFLYNKSYKGKRLDAKYVKIRIDDISSIVP